MDLTFILLITFIITFPLIEQGIPLKLPKGKASSLSDEQSRTINLDKDGYIFLDNNPVSLEELDSIMLDLGGQNPDIIVMVRADKRLAYGGVVDVLRILHAANITKMVLVTEAE
jgi:biopolymer transport protein ExbD